ncbi:MAG: dihydrofolate reductase family protein [Nocardiopsaceae bacterium]|jgi:dihydrofolate reductase|nr:dihydrofolate reductase family protein [Nocardiopsaceae bacterium]
MGKIIISANVTLDGVVQDPGGDEGFARGGWFGEVGGSDRAEWARVALAEALAAAALLLGRRSYEWFAARWSSRTGELAERLTSMPKYVVSSALRDPGWDNSTVLAGDALTDVATLKQQLTGDIVVYGSFRLGHALIAHDLVDELRLMIFPFVLGAGQRLFGETGGTTPMRRVSTRAVGESLALLTYQPVRDA